MNLREVNTHIKPVIKIVIAVVLIFCFFSFPYWYFTVVRFVCCFGLWLLFTKYKNHFIRVALIPFIILYNPIVEYELSKSVWLIFDVLLAIVLVIWAILDITLRLDKSHA
jgi:hypothetical protein